MDERDRSAISCYRGKPLPEHNRFHFDPLRKMQLNVDKQVLDDVIWGIIDAQGRHMVEVTKVDTMIIFYILSKIRINLGHFIVLPGLIVIIISLRTYRMQ